MRSRKRDVTAAIQGLHEMNAEDRDNEIKRRQKEAASAGNKSVARFFYDKQRPQNKRNKKSD